MHSDPKQPGEDGKLEERVLLYDSKKTSDAKRKWDINRLELYAGIWATEAHRFLLIGRPYIWITDFAALKHNKINEASTGIGSEMDVFIVQFQVYSLS